MDLMSKSELELLIGIMKKMEHAAIQENWQELSRLDNSRRELLQYNSGIEQCKAGSVACKSHTATESRYAELVTEILHLDKLIMKTASNARSKLLAENRDLSAQVNAKANYALTSQFSLLE